MTKYENLAYWWVHRIVGKKHPAYQDCLQASLEAILEAARRYDRNPLTSPKFRNYVTHWIRNYITKTVSRASQVIRVQQEMYLSVKDWECVKPGATRAQTSAFNAINGVVYVKMESFAVDGMPHEPDVLDEIMRVNVDACCLRVLGRRARAAFVSCYALVPGTKRVSLRDYARRLGVAPAKIAVTLKTAKAELADHWIKHHG